jgi:signal transduction histidine kinase
LEQRVADRTAELEQANRQLSALLDVLEERVAKRTRELTIFLDLTLLVRETQSLPDILGTALGRILEAGHCQAVCLHLLGQEDESCLELVAQRGLSNAQQQQLERLPLEGPLADWLAWHFEPVLDWSPAATPRSAALRLEDLPVSLVVPLQRQGRLQGALSYFRQSDLNFSLEDISLLSALADQLGIVVENHRLRGHIEEIAVVAERQRLARDLHDSITQSLYSLNLFAHAGREAAEDGDAERLDDSLARVEEITLAVLKEMRLLLHQLRPLDLTEQNLAEALQIRFDSVERRLGIEVDFRVEGQQELPDQVAEALYRAALETLNNSLKHAEASRVTVYLEMVTPTVTLKIIDDGRGFDPERVSRGMGLRNIQERLEQLAGGVKISSAPGAGTTVELAVTVADEPGNG